MGVVILYRRALSKERVRQVFIAHFENDHPDKYEVYGTLLLYRDFVVKKSAWTGVGVRVTQEDVVRVGGMRKGTRKGDGPERQVVSVFSVLFEGILEVADHERFCQVIRHGIGPAKALGFGLLSVAPDSH